MKLKGKMLDVIVMASAMMALLPTKASAEIENLKNLTITDATAYENVVDSKVEKFTYRRSINANEWSSWFTPFSIDVNILTKNDIEVSAIENIRNYDDDEDGEVDRTVLEVIKVNGGNLNANTPYIIYSSKTAMVEIELENVDLKSADNTNDVVIESATTTYTFRGTYSTMYPEDTKYIVSENAITEARKIQPQRWYMEVEGRENPYIETPAAMVREFSLQLVGEENLETGIRTIYPQSQQKTVSANGIFDLSGRKMNTTQKGINIINGRKVLK